jgi:hypothetical protein
LEELFALKALASDVPEDYEMPQGWPVTAVGMKSTNPVHKTEATGKKA